LHELLGLLEKPKICGSLYFPPCSEDVFLITVELLKLNLGVFDIDAVAAVGFVENVASLYQKRVVINGSFPRNMLHVPCYERRRRIIQPMGCWIGSTAPPAYR
jgi:hypothetical protein